MGSSFWLGICRSGRLAYDLAVFSSTYKLGQAQLRLLLSAYDSDSILDVQSLISRIEYYEKYYRLIEILWWNIRHQPMKSQLESLAYSLAGINKLTP